MHQIAFWGGGGKSFMPKIFLFPMIINGLFKSWQTITYLNVETIVIHH